MFIGGSVYEHANGSNAMANMIWIYLTFSSSFFFPSIAIVTVCCISKVNFPPRKRRNFCFRLERCTIYASLYTRLFDIFNILLSYTDWRWRRCRLKLEPVDYCGYRLIDTEAHRNPICTSWHLTPIVVIASHNYCKRILRTLCVWSEFQIHLARSVNCSPAKPHIVVLITGDRSLCRASSISLAQVTLTWFIQR